MSANSFRKPCTGKNCNRLILVERGVECRKCRRKRIHAGLKKIKKAEKEERKAK